MKHKDVAIPGEQFAELVGSLRGWKNRNEHGYRFAMAARGALRRVDKALSEYIDNANKVRQDDERILRTLEELRDNSPARVSNIPPEQRATIRPPPNARKGVS